MPHFDWRTEEDGEWPISAEQDKKTASRFRRLVWLIPIILLALVGGGWFVNDRLNRQIDRAEKAIEEEVLVVHHLLGAAAAAQDVDLFMAQHAPADSLWYDVQQLLLEQNLFLNRTPLGLYVHPQPETGEEVVDLSFDATQAWVQDLVPYWTEEVDRTLAKVQLMRTALYQRQEGRWWHAPLPRDLAYWGAWQTIEGDYLTLIFPEKEAAVADRLAADLDGYVARLCGETAVSCPPDLRFRLRFSYETTAMAALAQNYRLLNLSIMRNDPPHTYRVNLPTPSLVGLPVDDAGYQALLRGYGRWVTSMLAARLDPQQGATDQFVIAQLQKLGLAPPPPPEFTLNFPPKEPPPIPLPTQEILVTCQLDDETTLWRYQPTQDNWIDTRAAAGNPPPLFNLFLVSPMPGGKGVLLAQQRQVANRQSTRFSLWHNDQEIILFETEDKLEFADWLTPRISANGRYLLFYRLQSLNDLDPLTPHFYLLDRLACATGNCALQPVDGIPYWPPQPEPTRSIIADVNTWPENLYLGDGAGLVLRHQAIGWQPFWLDAQRFGYARAPQGAEYYRPGNPLELVLTQIDHEQEDVQVLLDQDDFLAVLQAVEPHLPATQLQTHMNDILASPDAKTLYISLLTWPAAPNVQGSPQQHILAYDVAEANLQWLFTTAETANFPLTLAQNGRFLVVPTAGSDKWYVQLYNTATGNIFATTMNPSYDHPYPALDWSADEQWLVIADDRLLHLIAPEFDYKRTVLHNFTGCHSASWINP